MTTAFYFRIVAGPVESILWLGGTYLAGVFTGPMLRRKFNHNREA